VRGRQIKSSLACRNIHFLQSHSHEMQPESIPEGLPAEASAQAG